MDNNEAILEIRRRKAALYRVETILGDSTPAEMDFLRRVLATCSAPELTLLRDVLLNPEGESSPEGHAQVVASAQATATANGSAKPNTKRKTLVKSVEDAIELFDVITSSAILGHLMNQGVKFGNKKPIAAVSAILAKLRHRGKLKLIEKGTARTPTVFRKAGGAARVAS